MAYKPSSDKILFFTAGFLTIFGLVMVYSASSVVASSQTWDFFLFLSAPTPACRGRFYFFDFHDECGLSRLAKTKSDRSYAGDLRACSLVCHDSRQNQRAHRWLRYGALISFQPSEVAKLIVLVFIAAFLHKYESEINQPLRRLVPFGLVVGLFAGLIAIEPDLGQALCSDDCGNHAIRGRAGLAILRGRRSCWPSRPFTSLSCAVPFRWERIKSFLNPFHYPLGSGWQISQSLTAVGTGGISGLGLGASRQKLFFLPEASSDFIFAVIGEELGLIGTCLVALAFLIFFYRGFELSCGSPDRFGFYLGLGITLMVALQGFINISMVLAMMPTKGIALPFMSQGGSSLLLNLLATGVLLNLSNHNKLAEVAD